MPALTLAAAASISSPFMHSPLESLSEGKGDLGAQTRSALRARPLLLLDTATSLSSGGPPVPAEVSSACREELGLLDSVPVAALRDAFEETLLGRDVEVALQWLQDIGFIAKFFPELEATLHLQQEPGRHHKDVWEHTKWVVKQAVPRPIVRWAALLHDIGKVPTRRFTDTGVHFHGHARSARGCSTRCAGAFPSSDPARQRIRFLIRHHLRSAQYEPSWTDSAVRRFYREMGDNLQDLLDLSRADITSKRPGRRRSLLFQISSLSDRLEALRAADAIVPPLPKGLGTAIMNHFEIPPSRVIGELRSAVEAAVERGDIEAHRDEAYYVDYIVQNQLMDSLK